MVKYLYSISFMVFMLGFMSSNISASDTKEEGDYKPPVKFESFDYDPNIKRFEGKFFQEVENVASQLGGFYTEKYMKVTYKDLPSSQAELKRLNSVFNKEELNQLKLRKGMLKQKGVTLETQDLERYQTLGRQEGEVLLQEAVIALLEVQSKKYNNRRILMTDMSEFFQKFFYLVMLQPQSIAFSSHSYYLQEAEERRENKYIMWNGSVEQISSKFKPEDREGIDLEKMKETCSYIFGFFNEYVLQLQHTKSENQISFGKSYLKSQKVINSNAFNKVRNLIPLSDSFSNENISEVVKYFLIKNLRKDKKQMENEVKPLANFYLLFIETLESFQKEVGERKIN